MGDLISYLTEVEYRPFRWGQHDCLTFSNQAVKLQRGFGWADEWLTGYTTPRGAFLKYRREQLNSDSFETIIDVADERMSRELTLHPRFGYIVGRQCSGALGWAFGVVGKGMALFVDEQGLVPSELRHDDLYWRPA